MAGRALLLEKAITAAPGASVAALPWRFRGELRVTVVAKATFSFAHDGPTPRAPPKPILWSEVHHKNHPGRSIRFTTDIAPRLQRADILFTGHAHAPPGAAVESALVRLGVFQGARMVLDKALVVRQKGGFQSIPLVYEKAYGGIGVADNPFGVGVKAGAEEPSVIDPAAPAHPAGLAPISRTWPRRRASLAAMSGTLGSDIVEIPEAFSWDALQAAPPDQQVGILAGNEWIVMDGLHPTQGRVRMCLPAARGAARVFGLAAHGAPEGAPLDLALDLLHIDGEEQRITATFRGSFAVPSEEALAGVHIVAGVESHGDPIVWTAAAPPAETGKTSGPAPARVDSTMELSDEDVDGSDDPTPVPGTNGPWGGAQRPDAARPTGKLDAAAGFGASPKARAALPFQRSGDPSPLARPGASDSVPAAKAPSPRRDFSSTVAADPDEIAAVSVRGPTPFQRSHEPSPLARPSAPGPMAPSPRRDFSSTVAADPDEFAAASARSPTPFAVASPMEPVPVTKPMEPVPVATPMEPVPTAKPAATPLPATPAAERASPWAPSPQAAPAPRAPRPPPKPAGPPPVSAALKRGLYDRFGKP